MIDDTARNALDDRLFKGRGSALNPTSRFDRLATEAFDDGWESLALAIEETGRPAT